MKEINSQLYGGSSIFSKTKSAYSSDILYCSSSDNCPLYKNNQCLMATRLSRIDCICGKISRQNGTSPRSGSYYKIANETRQRATYNKLKQAEDHFFALNDYYFIKTVYVAIWQNISTQEYVFTSPYDLPYVSWGNDGVRENWKNLGEYAFIKKDDLPKEVLEKILNFKPRPLFGGGTIARYQDEIVPQIKAGILKYAPLLAKECGIESVNYVGMMGLLKTLTPPLDFKKNNINFHYDGQFVTTEDKAVIDSSVQNNGWSKAIGNVEEVKAKFIPFDDLYVEILSNDWVNNQSVVKRNI